MKHQGWGDRVCIVLIFFVCTMTICLLILKVERSVYHSFFKINSFCVLFKRALKNSQQFERHVLFGFERRPSCGPKLALLALSRTFGWVSFLSQVFRVWLFEFDFSWKIIGRTDDKSMAPEAKMLQSNLDIFRSRIWWFQESVPCEDFASCGVVSDSIQHTKMLWDFWC